MVVSLEFLDNETLIKYYNNLIKTYSIKKEKEIIRVKNEIIKRNL